MASNHNRPEASGQNSRGRFSGKQHERGRENREAAIAQGDIETADKARPRGKRKARA